MTKTTRLQLKYKREDVKMPIVRFWWFYDYSEKLILPEQMMTGMLVTWRLEKEDFQESDNVFQVSFSPKTEVFRTTVNLLAGALTKNMSLADIWKDVKAFKNRMTHQARYCTVNPCSSGEMSPTYVNTTLKDFSKYLNLTATNHMFKDMPEETINEGFKIFHLLTFCSVNLMDNSVV